MATDGWQEFRHGPNRKWLALDWRPVGQTDFYASISVEVSQVAVHTTRPLVVQQGGGRHMIFNFVCREPFLIGEADTIR